MQQTKFYKMKTSHGGNETDWFEFGIIPGKQKDEPSDAAIVLQNK